MGERKGTKGLELWCRRMTEGYPGVNVVNMTTSWRDGLAFCAIIHHFRPDLIEFSKLNKDDIYHNNELAFRVAEHHLGIPALLEPEDMVEFPVPDRLSILTYLSQFYQTFVVAQGKSPSRIAPKRPATSPEHGIVSPASTSPPSKVAFVGGKARREPCAKCGLPVFIAERLNVGKLLYHRTCFRCARCQSQLTLADYYETENGQFCCETCPDEEKTVEEQDSSSILTRSLSDEEKSASLKKSEEEKFETALEHPADASRRNSTVNSSRFTNARSFFINSQVECLNSDSGGEEEPPDLPKTKPPIVRDRTEESFGDSGFPNNKLKTDVNIQSSVSLNITGDEPEKSHDIVTKDTISAEGKTSSLVKARMRLFESKSDAPNESRNVNNQVPLMNSNSASRDVEVSNLHSFKDNTPDAETRDSIITSPNEEESTEEAPKDNSIVNTSDSNEDSFKKDSIQTTDLEESREDIKTQPTDLPQNLEETPSEIEVPCDSSRDLNETPSVVEISDDVSQDLEGTPSDAKAPDDLLSPQKLEETPSDVKLSDDNLQTLKETPSIIEISDDLSQDLQGTPSVIEISDDPSQKETPPVIEISDDISQNLDESTLQNESNKPQVPSLPTEDPKPVQAKSLEEYPDDLNPFGDEEKETEKPARSVSLNPFEDDEDDVPPEPSPKPAARRKIKPSPADRDLSSIYIERVSVNPFEEDEEEEETAQIPEPSKRKIIEPPKISLNPFWSDDEEKDEDRPVPKPRISKTSIGVPEARPRESCSSSNFGSLSSISSSQSGHKKKKPAPKPPSMLSGTESGQSSITSSPCHSVTHSPRATPKVRKAKKAPPPPTSTPLEGSSAPPQIDIVLGDDFEKEKFAKDEVNRNRQSQNLSLQSPSSSENSASLGAPNKSTYGKWKRRKGQAPARPIPQRRTIKSLPLVEVRRELDVIEIQQQGLEKQGVRLEQIIREKCEGPGVNPDESLPPEIEEMVLQLFELVNEKNELFRRQAELMYLRRQQKLEEEHADIEYQIRCLMLQPEANKTDSDKAREEELISRLVEIVERRNEIIECLEMDRVREAEEDDSINNQLNLYSLKKEEDKSAEMKNAKKDKKKHKKEKKIKLKGQKVDADKDIDESESTEASVKDKKKKKFNIF